MAGINLRLVLILLLIARLDVACQAHPMPNSLVMLDVRTGVMKAGLKLPLAELELVYGKNLPADSLRVYILRHFHVWADEKNEWAVVIDSLRTDSAEQPFTGKYYELCAYLTLTPPPNASVLNFTLKYDLIIHQLVTHKALVYVRSEGDSSVRGKGQESAIGVIRLDPRNNTISPFPVNLAKSGWWEEWRNMFRLGVTHIAEGTDHLLFLLVLLLPAGLTVRRGRWSRAGDRRYAFLRVVKIVTAFTVGHSCTLVLAALKIVQLPPRPVEVLIAVSILVTAVHCIRPLFYGKEIYIAGGFGLVHGLAFASILSGMQMKGGQLALSILGFNLGIEAMQLGVVLVVLPVLLWLTRNPIYTYFRVAGAAAAMLLSIVWIAERLRM